MFSRPFCAALLVLPLLSACGGSGGGGGGMPNPAPVAVDCPVARVVASSADLVPGPVARGSLGDLVIENSKLRAIVQKGGRNWYNISQFGGNIIDALPRADDGSLIGEDHYEEAVLGTNVESAPNYQSVTVLEPGGSDVDGNCLRAVIRATGPDDLLDFVNGSSAIRDMGFMFPASADDVDLPITISTDYVLNPGAPYIEMRTRLINDGADDQDIYLVEYANGSGEVESFQYGYGFGEPLVTAPCDSCRSLVYAGHDGGTGVSYGIIHDYAGSSSVSVSGVSVLVYGGDATALFVVGAEAVPPNFTVPGDGELEVLRYFAVAAGGVSSIYDIQHQILGETVGTLAGIVLDPGGLPVANAEIAVITSERDFDDLTIPPAPAGVPRGPEIVVANHFRTDTTGRFIGSLRPGSYELRVNVPGRLAGEGFVQTVEIVADEVTTAAVTAPRASGIRVRVVDENDAPIAAKVQLIGVDSSPDAGEPQNSESILGQVELSTGVFGDFSADRLAQFQDPDDELHKGIMLSEFATLDSGSAAVTVGDTGVLLIEPGDYQLSVSRGPRYSEHLQDLSVVEGQNLEVTARVVRVVDTPDIVFGDFHVHSFDSPDSEVTNRERVATYLAEDVDFFTPSDHGMRVDFEPVIAAMGVAGLVASAPSAEITTFDYGHYNAWPVAVDASPANTDEASQSGDPKISLGSVDWGRPAPVGMDFPSAGNYGLTPAEIFADADSEPFLDGRDTVTQINHVEGFFGAAGLAIDTGQTPPQSGNPPASKRLDPAISNLFSDQFDTLELWIGVDGLEHQNTHFLGENMGDWFNMLNQGILKTLIANSDTHDRRLTSLATRNWISAPAAALTGGRPNLAALRSDPHLLGDAVIEGYSIGSNSLFMTPKLSSASGKDAGLAQTDSFGTRSRPLPLAAPDEAVDLSVMVQAPAWAQFDLIEVYINGQTVRQADESNPLLPAEPPRYNLCGPEFSAVVAPASVVAASVGGTDYLRLEHSESFSDLIGSAANVAAGQDYWVVVIARGREATTAPLWPVVPNDFFDSGDGLQTRSAADTGMFALAVSNPIYVDADGDGEWTAPGVMTHDGSLLDMCP